jgi:cytochrome c-type biogenesis protein CcmE
MNQKVKVAAGIIVIVMALGYWVFQGVAGNEIYYLTVSELPTRKADLTDQRVKIGGVVQTGSIHFLNPLNVEFLLAQGEASVPVKYQGTTPDMFKDESELIVEGTFDGEMIHADLLIAKCASKYETEHVHSDSTARKKEA